jgi:hypothetical protein
VRGVPCLLGREISSVSHAAERRSDRVTALETEARIPLTVHTVTDTFHGMNIVTVPIAWGTAYSVTQLLGLRMDGHTQSNLCTTSENKVAARW